MEKGSQIWPNQSVFVTKALRETAPPASDVYTFTAKMKRLNAVYNDPLV